MRYNYKPFKYVKLKRLTTSNVGKDVDLLELSCVADNVVTLVNHLGKWSGSFLQG